MACSAAPGGATEHFFQELPALLRDRMRPSQIVIRSATAAPWLFRPVVRLIAQIFPYKVAKPHWLLRHLKDSLGVCISRRVRLRGGFVVKVDPFDGGGSAISSMGETEPETVTLFEQLVRPGSQVIDAGAYIGQYSLIASRIVGREGVVHSFEPTPGSFAQLQWNVRANKCPNVTCSPLALSDTFGQQTLYCYSGSSDQNSFQKLDAGARRTVAVRVETLDRYAATHDLDRIAVIKIEG